MQRALRRDGLSFAATWVTSEPAFRQALKDFAPDIVLSDYALPGFTGLAAVRMVRESHADLPFVLVTGVLEDEAAVAVVKAGANDYVRKDRLAYLPVAVRRALAEAAALRNQRALEARIASLARTDELTGLANRSAFLERLHDDFAAARRDRFRFAVFYLDLDHFKDINDSLGHSAGDQLLCDAANRISRGVRATDLVARFGGDEFAVLQTDIADPSDAGTLAAKLLRILAAPFTFNGATMHVTASIGIALYRPDVRLPEDMLTQADLALYRAKDEGRDRYCFHSAELDEAVRNRLRLSEEMHTALENNEFELFYQPQITQPEGRIVGLEALIRWHHPRRGVLAADAFIPAADRSGILLAVGRWALNAAIRQIGAWRAAGIPVVTVTINPSAAQIRAFPGFEQDLTEALARWQVPPELIGLQLSEAGLGATAREHAVDLKRLQTLGVQLVLDEFGAGWLSLDHVGMLGFSRLKIARRFVAGAVADQREAALMHAVIGLARALDIQVIADGVQNAAQLAFLAEAGCMVAQGCHLCPPLPADQIAPLLRAGRITPAANNDPP